MKAANHSYYKNFIYVFPGSIPTVITAFLSRQLVTYTWIVTPTTIEDEYLFTLDAGIKIYINFLMIVFETYVPFPLLTVVPNVLDLKVLECTPYTRIDFNITNHGFIRAG